MKGEIYIFKEIIIQRDNFDIQIYDKKISLPEEIREWQKLLNQDIKYINRLRKQGETIQYFKVMKNKQTGGKKTRGYYYRLYSCKNFTYEKRLYVVNMILNKMKHSCGMAINEYINHMQPKTSVDKKTNDTLFNVESILLSSLGEYLLRAKDDSNILYSEDMNFIQRTEVATFGEYIRSKNGGNYIRSGENKNAWNINITEGHNIKRFEKRYSSETRRWKKSKTYRMNEIYSFDNGRERELHHKREGLIDWSKPYMSEWCVVDTENTFIFNEVKYKIGKDIVQYNIRKKKPNYDDYKNDYQMDQILVYEQDNKLYFFDQNIEQIDNNKILILANKL